jgi:hypothetical protein
VAFTCVRNPYTRILSSFFDKICGIQRNGSRYRGNLVPMVIQKYGIEVGGPDGKDDFDQIASFRRFLLFARDTIRWKKPMDPDIHWSADVGPCVDLHRERRTLRPHLLHRAVRRGNAIGAGPVRKRPVAVDLAAVPRFNESEGHGPKRAHPVEDYFDDLSMHLVKEMYHRTSTSSATTSTIPRTGCRWARSTSTRCMPSWGSEGGCLPPSAFGLTPRAYLPDEEAAG